MTTVPFLRCVIACFLVASVYAIFCYIEIDLRFLLASPSGTREEVTTVSGASATEDGGARRLPWFTLHVGPPKTGTSSIQEFLVLSGTVDSLKNDAYMTMIRSAPGFKKKANWPADSGGIVHLPPVYLQKIQSALDTNHNFLISDEGLANLGDPGLRALWEAIGNNFNVRVVQTYRRLHEFLASRYNQRNKQCSCKNDGKKCRKKAIPTFQEWNQKSYGTKSDNTSSSELLLLSYPNPVVNVPRAYARFESTENATVSFRVFNMHQEGNLVRNFVCQMIPHATQTCQFVTALDEASQVRRANTQVVLDYDRMATYAQETGVINASVYTHQPKIAQKISNFQKHERKRTDKDLPQDCPSSEIMTFIHNESLRMEEIAMPIIYPKEYQEWKNKGLLPQHLQSFQQSWKNTVDGKKLCNVDCKATFELTEWKEFLEREFPPPTP